MDDMKTILQMEGQILGDRIFEILTEHGAPSSWTALGKAFAAAPVKGDYQKGLYKELAERLMTIGEHYDRERRK
jgi:hypothetical protein